MDVHVRNQNLLKINVSLDQYHEALWTEADVGCNLESSAFVVHQNFSNSKLPVKTEGNILTNAKFLVLF